MSFRPRDSSAVLQRPFMARVPFANRRRPFKFWKKNLFHGHFSKQRTKGSIECLKFTEKAFVLKEKISKQFFSTVSG